MVCAGFDDAELLARIRGQTRDLPVRLISAAPVELLHPAQSELQALAREYSAEFVVTVDQQPNGSRTVYVLDVRAAELRVRSTPAPDRRHRFARSAIAETVALIVRGELSDALAAHAAQSPPAQESARSDATTVEQPPAERDVSEPNRATTSAPASPTLAPAESDEPADVAASADTYEHQRRGVRKGSEPSWLGPPTLSLELAGRVSVPMADRYFLGAALGLRLSFAHLSVGLSASSTLPNRAQRQGLTLGLREHSVGLDAFAHLQLTAAALVGLGVTGRWLFYRRSAESSAPEWNAEPADTSSTLAIGPQAELRWQLLQPLGLAVRAGLDVLLRPISFRYRTETNQSDPNELERQNRVAPWLAVGVYGSL